MALISEKNFAAGAAPAGYPPPLPPKARKLAEILLARAKQGECVISQDELSRITGWDPTTVRRHLKELKRRGLIEWERRKRLPNRYRFLDRVQLHHNLGVINPGLAHHVGRGQNVLLLGPEGMGKTFQLSLLSQDGFAPVDAVLYLPFGTIREVLLTLADQLAALGEIHEDDLSRPLSRLSAKELSALALSAVSRSPRRFLILVDDLDRAAPSFRRFVLQLLSLYNVQVVAAAREEKKLEELVDHFVVVRLPPLSEEETARWVETFLRARGIPVIGGEKGLRKLAREIHIRSGGNPRKIQAFLKKIEAQGYVDRKLLREEIKTGGQFQFSDMTWILVLTAALALAIRYLGLGLHDRLLYVLAGFTYALGFLLRWFSYRWRRK